MFRLITYRLIMTRAWHEKAGVPYPLRGGPSDLKDWLRDEVTRRLIMIDQRSEERASADSTRRMIHLVLFELPPSTFVHADRSAVSVASLSGRATQSFTQSQTQQTLRRQAWNIF